ASTFRGLLGEKLGMTQVFDENNRIVPVTVVKAGPCVVTQVRTPEVDGYSAVQLGFGAIDPRKVNKPEGGHFAKAGVTPRRHLVELRTEVKIGRASCRERVWRSGGGRAVERSGHGSGGRR